MVHEKKKKKMKKNLQDSPELRSKLMRALTGAKYSSPIASAREKVHDKAIARNQGKKAFLNFFDRVE